MLPCISETIHRFAALCTLNCISYFATTDCSVILECDAGYVSYVRTNNNSIRHTTVLLCIHQYTLSRIYTAMRCRQLADVRCTSVRLQSKVAIDIVVDKTTTADEIRGIEHDALSFAMANVPSNEIIYY